MSIHDRGMASMTPEQRRRISSLGGKAAHKAGTAHRWTKGENGTAAKAGRKGGLMSAKKRAAAVGVLLVGVLIGLACPVQAQERVMRWTFIGLQAADTVTSCVNFSRGLVEANPLLPSSCGRLVLVKSTGTIGLIYIAQRVEPRRRWLAYTVMAGISAYPIILNLRRR